MTRSSLSFAALLLLAAPTAFSQAPPTAPMPPSAAVPPSPPAREDQRRIDRKIVIHGGPEEGSMGIAPPGTWWKNPDTIAKLSLSADQQKKMDDIFRQNRIQLIHMKASLEEEQINLEPLLNTNPVDSGKALGVISKIADLRADLEKANARMLLNLRSVLTADQWAKLQEDRRTHRGSSMDFRFKGGGTGPMGPLGSLDPEGSSDLTDRLANLQIKLDAMNIHIPEIHIPEIHIPEIHIPQFTMPEIVVPKVVIPEFEYPSTHTPAT